MSEHGRSAEPSRTGGRSRHAAPSPASQPSTSQPSTSQPSTSQSSTGQSSTSQSSTGQHDGAPPDSGQPGRREIPGEREPGPSPSAREAAGEPADVPPVVAVDAMGGDHAPEEVVAGAIAAHRQGSARIILIGRPAQVRPLLANDGMLGAIRLVAAEDSVAMEEGALTSWRRPRSSIAIACQLVHLGQATSVLSAGSTGAIVGVARMRLRALPGVLRPALAAALPTRPNPTLLIDAGAIADPKPEMLAQFAQFGVAYAEAAFGISEPRVGLLSIGAEPGKGNKLSKRAFELLSGEPAHGAMPISFVGNVEGGDLLTGKADVIVAEGFAGNIALKTLEGTAAYTAGQFRSALTASRAARLGALLQRRELRGLHAMVDSQTYGGAALLGLEGAVVIAHGAARARGISAACRMAGELASGQIAARIRERIGPHHRPGPFRRWS